MAPDNLESDINGRRYIFKALYNSATIVRYFRATFMENDTHSPSSGVSRIIVPAVSWIRITSKIEAVRVAIIHPDCFHFTCNPNRIRASLILRTTSS